MSSGFNTDVRLDEQVFHVQTEDRGPARPIIDTVVYQNGRVVHRRSHDYRELAESTAFTPEDLRQLVEMRHRMVIDDLRAGALSADLAAAAERASRAGGIQVQLLNPESWLSGGRVSLEVEITRRADSVPAAGAQVDAAIEGALQEARHSGTSDDQGRVKIEFPLPPLGKGDLALVIQARADAAKDEIRFAMRSRTRGQPSSSSQ
jgi:hypothetical protein